MKMMLETDGIPLCDGKDEPAVIVWAWLLSRRFELLVHVNLQQLGDSQWVCSCCNMSGREVWPLSSPFISFNRRDRACKTDTRCLHTTLVSSRSNNMSHSCIEARVVTVPTFLQSVPVKVCGSLYQFLEKKLLN